MLTKIVLVIALCSGVKLETVQSKLVELRKLHPDAAISYRIDTKAQCYKGQVLTGRDAKLADQLK